MLREATEADVSAILRWRNHPDVRALSFTTHEISQEEHARWWAGVRSDPDRLVMVYERSGFPSGVVAFDLHDDGRMATWSFYLDVSGLEERGEILPAWLEIEREVVAYAFDRLGLSVLTGEMLGSNTAVRQLHRRYGFEEVGTYQRKIDGQIREVVQIELRSENRRTRSKVSKR